MQTIGGRYLRGYRGLKCFNQDTIAAVSSRYLRGYRGLKCGIANAGLTPTVSIPARVSWIEIELGSEVRVA